jgi:predicted Fe-Mo cluster-binding NifX family protein
MKVAMTIWGNRISPVFDASQKLLVVEVEDGKIAEEAVFSIEPGRFDRFEELVRELKIELLLCGAVCNLGLDRLSSLGIEVVPFLTGEVSQILTKWLLGEEVSEFAMPGCRRGGCCRRMMQEGGVILQCTNVGKDR